MRNKKQKLNISFPSIELKTVDVGGISRVIDKLTGHNWHSNYKHIERGLLHPDGTREIISK